MQALSYRICAIALAALAVVVIPASASTLQFTIATSEDDVSMEAMQGGVRVSMALDDARVLGEAGLPDLPYRVVNVVLPQGQRLLSHRAVAAGEIILGRDLALTTAAVEKSQDGVTATSAAMAAVSDGVYPGQPARYLGAGTLHGYSIASFAVYPVQVRDNELTLQRSITLHIETEVDAAVGTVVIQRYRPDLNERAAQRVRDLVVNPSDVASYVHNQTRVKQHGGFAPTSFPSLEGSPVDYVIVTPDSLADEFQPLADWKTEKGVPTVIRTTEWIEANYPNGVDQQETIRNFVVDAYQKWGISYLLLGGDDDVLVPRMMWSGFYDGGRSLPVDLYFAGLDGSWNADHDAIFGEALVDAPDLYVEVWVGRLPASTGAEVTILVDKIKTYETPNDRSYTSRALTAAEVLFPQPYTGVEPITLNGANLAEQVAFLYWGGMDVVRMYETYTLFPGSVPESRAAVIDSVNVGFNHFNHVGHGFRFNMSVGNASILNADADAFTNGDRLTNLYMLNCTAVAFNYFCLAEHWLLNPNGGAVTTIGANESAYPNTSSFYMNKYYDLLFNDGTVQIGPAFHLSREPRTFLASLGDNVDFWTHYIYTLLADPEMPLWTGPVDTLQVSHTAGVGLGTTDITVTVLDGGGSPAESVTVCLSKGEDDYQIGLTDGAGEVTLGFRAERAGAIKVVATGVNHARHESSIAATAGGGAYVSYAGMTVDDDNSGGTSGNGDGVIDAGETIDLTFSVENTGGSASGVVDLVLRSNTGGATVLDSTASVGVVGSSATEVAGDPFRVSFSSSMLDEQTAAFDLIVKDTGVEMWNDEVKREVHAPELALVGLRIDDTAFGDGDGVVDAGETFTLYYEIKNFGTGASPGLAATIADLDNGFTFNDSLDTFPALATITAAENVGGFELIEPSLAGLHRIELTAIDSYGRVFTDRFELRAPFSPTALVINPRLGPDRLEISWAASPSADVERYNVYRSATPGGPYALANVDPVDHTVYVDVGLSGSTFYYYVATAVDTSGNESTPSAEYSGSTNPSYTEGWPILMPLETTSSPAVGDIDGDGDLEIVQGNDFVYAWHHNGVELIDGDGDPQTWGIINPRGQSFVSPIALARIDGQPGLDIIAASRDTREVYIFTHQGDTLSNWPQPVINTIRAGLSVGDLDGDNLLEIIAIDEKGVLYAWNHDGTEWMDGDSNAGTSGVFATLPGCFFQYSTPALADLDGDGDDDIIVGTEGNFVYAFDETGANLPGWPVALLSDVSGSVAIGDIDDNGDLEVVVDEAGGTIQALNHDGTVLWTTWLPNAGFFRPSPALADVTGDGKLETFLPASNGNIYGLKSNGGGLSGWPRQHSSFTTTESSPIIADLDGDGNLDIVLGDETEFINAWTANGSNVAGFPLATTDALRSTPAVADLTGDGNAELVAAGWDKQVYVWNFIAPYAEDPLSWTQFHANVHNDGLVGRVIPTGVLDVAFAYDVVGESVDLRWYLPPTAGYLFEILRAPVTNDRPGEFRVLARDVAVGADGALHYADRDVRAGDRFVYRIEETGGEGEYETPAVYVPVRSAGMTQNYPNPFNPVTRITYWVPEGAGQRVELVVYDVRGARVRTLVSGAVVGGRHEVVWDGRNDQGQRVGSGVYFYRMVQDGFSATRKMLLLK